MLSFLYQESFHCFGPEYLFLLLPSFSSLSSMARKLTNFQSCTILLVAFLCKCQVFGLKISFKKAIGSSSYSSITIPSRVLLLIFMEFLSSSFLAEVSFKKNFHRRGLGGFLSSITVYEAMWNCFKTCEKHGHSAMLQLSHLLLFVPFKELFFRQ